MDFNLFNLMYSPRGREITMTQCTWESRKILSTSLNLYKYTLPLGKGAFCRPLTWDDKEETLFNVSFIFASRRYKVCKNCNRSTYNIQISFVCSLIFIVYELWLWHFLYSVGPHPVSSLHIYSNTFVVSQAFKASPLVCRGPLMSTLVLYCWCYSDSASVLLYFTLNNLFLKI